METILAIIGVLVVAVCGYFHLIFNEKSRRSNNLLYILLKGIFAILYLLFLILTAFINPFLFFKGHLSLRESIFFTSVLIAEALVFIYFSISRKSVAINFKSKKTWTVIEIIFSILIAVFLFSPFGVFVLQHIGIY